MRLQNRKCGTDTEAGPTDKADVTDKKNYSDSVSRQIGKMDIIPGCKQEQGFDFICFLEDWHLELSKKRRTEHESLYNR